MWWFGFLACQSEETDTAQAVLDLQPPAITEVTWVCEENQWTVSVTTDAWTGNGYLWLGTETRYERHPLYSIQADPMGAEDLLRIVIETTADWRDAQAGRFTGFQCQESSAVSGYIVVLDPQTMDVADCYTFVGESTSAEAVWADVSLPTCDG